MFEVAVVAALVSVVFIALCGCPNKKKEVCGLDTDTPLPSSTPLPLQDRAGGGNLYDEANERKPAATPDEEIEGNYEDLGRSSPAPAAGPSAATSVVVGRSHAGAGMSTKRSEPNIPAMRSNHTMHDSKAGSAIMARQSTHLIDTVDSRGGVEATTSRAKLPTSMSTTAFPPPPAATTEEEDDEPPPPVPQKTDAAEVLYDVGPGTGGGLPPVSSAPGNSSPPAQAAPPPPLQASQSVESMSWRQSKQSLHKTVSNTQSNKTWAQSKHKIEEDDDAPPPPVPQKTAEAQMIYGETIPAAVAAAASRPAAPAAPTPPAVSVASSNSQFRPQESVPRSESRPAISAPAPPPMTGPSSTGSRPANLSKQLQVMDDEEEDAAPSLPPKTAEAEELYDYGGGRKASQQSGGGQKPPSPAAAAGGATPTPPTPGKKPSQVSEATGMAYTEVTFLAEKESAAAPAPAAPAEVETSVYADIAFQ